MYRTQQQIDLYNAETHNGFFKIKVQHVTHGIVTVEQFGTEVSDLVEISTKEGAHHWVYIHNLTEL